MAAENKDDIIIAMLEEMKSGMKNQKSQQMDFSKLESLSKQLESSLNTTSDCTSHMESIMEEVHKPVVSQRKIIIDIVAKEIVFIFIGMIIIIAGLSSWLYLATRPDYDLNDNDLKYRYVKMKGEATPDRLIELENLFEINRDNGKIQQMQKDVEDYERAVQAKAVLDEQTRLQQLEAKKLNQQVNSIKNK